MTDIKHHWGSRPVNHEICLYFPTFYILKILKITDITLIQIKFLENLLYIKYFLWDLSSLIFSLSPIICQVFASTDFKFVFKAGETKYYVAACVVV